MKNETKLKKVLKFLEENGIKYTESKNKGKAGHSDLVLPSFRIYIKLQGEDDALFYESHHIGVHPIFIRNDETPKFVLEKVQKTIVKCMQAQQAAYMRKKQEKG